MSNQPHTPTTPEYVKDPAHFRAVYVDHMDSGKYDGPTPNMSERTRGAYALQFDRMIQAVEAAAEQRGAEEGWDLAIDYAWDDSSIYEADAKRAKAANPYRADQEGDDAQSST